MIIDYISDIHEDAYFTNKALTDKNIKEFIEPMSPKGEILIVAGDTSETNSRVVKLLDGIQRLFGYKKIYFVLGNHELYTNGNYPSYKEKVKNLKHMLRKTKNLILLDGQIEEYSGIKIGGCMMWYDGSYAKEYFKDYNDLNGLWNRSMPDSRGIDGLDYYSDLFHDEKNKFKKFYKKVDIIVTHISPLNKKRYINPMYQNDVGTSFFCFDGEKYLKETTAKHWFYGHVHNKSEFDLGNVKTHCNPNGYRREASRTIFKQIIIDI